MMQRLGRPADALKHSRRVPRSTPNNVDAAREVRIASMREEKTEKSSKGSAAAGFLGKLLGGDKEDKAARKKK